MELLAFQEIYEPQRVSFRASGQAVARKRRGAEFLALAW
jgi:hypothetical protein